ncbi:hypothetical protein Hhel01_02126 [Haloferula helveola]
MQAGCQQSAGFAEEYGGFTAIAFCVGPNSENLVRDWRVGANSVNRSLNVFLMILSNPLRDSNKKL